MSGRPYCQSEKIAAFTLCNLSFNFCLLGQGLGIYMFDQQSGGMECCCVVVAFFLKTFVFVMCVLACVLVCMFVCVMRILKH